MKTKLLSLLVILSISLFTTNTFAQTTLLPGEVMITGYYGDGTTGGSGCNEAFAFTSYVNLLPNTEIRFSEEDYDQWGGSATEGDLVWVNDTGSIIQAQTVINVVTQSQSAASTCTAVTVSHGSITFQGTGSWILGTSNEEIIVYQSSTVQTLGTAISVFLTDNASDATNTPPSLLGGPYIINFEGVDDDADVAVYSGPTAFSSFSDFVAQLTNTAANWTTQNGAGDNGVDGIAPEYPADLPVFDATLSTLDFNNETLFTYYPNPVNNALTIESKNMISNIIAFNILGQEVFRDTPNALSSVIDTSSLNNGAYFVQITVNEKTETIKIIKK